MAWFAPVPIGQSVSRLGLRSEASARNERGVDPYGIDTSIARFVELLRRDVPGARRARGRRRCPQRRPAAGRALEHGAHRPGQPHPRHVADGRRPAGAARPHRLRRVRHRRRARRSPSRRGAPTARRRSTSSRRSPGSTATSASASGCRRRSSTVTCRWPSSGGASSARCCSGSGITEVMPNPFLAPDTLARAGLDGDALRITQPARRRRERAAHVAAAGPAAGGGLQRVAPPRRRGAVRDRPRLPAEPSRAARRVRGARRRARRRGGAGGDGRVAGGRRGDGDRRPRRPGPPAARPAPDALGHARRRARRDRRRRRGRAGRPGGVRDRRAGGGAGARPAGRDRPASRSRRGGEPTSRQPSSDLDLAFALPDDVPAERLDKAIRQGAGGLLVDLDLFDVYRGAGAGRRDDAAWPTASGCRRRTAA